MKFIDLKNVSNYAHDSKIFTNFKKYSSIQKNVHKVFLNLKKISIQNVHKFQKLFADSKTIHQFQKLLLNFKNPHEIQFCSKV